MRISWRSPSTSVQCRQWSRSYSGMSSEASVTVVTRAPLPEPPGPVEEESGMFPSWALVLLIGLAIGILNPNPPMDMDGRREDSGRGVRELQGR